MGKAETVGDLRNLYGKTGGKDGVGVECDEFWVNKNYVGGAARNPHPVSHISPL